MSSEKTFGQPQNPMVNARRQWCRFKKSLEQNCNDKAEKNERLKSLPRRKAVPPLVPHPTKTAKKRRQRALKSQVAHKQRHLRLAISKMRQQVEAIRCNFCFVSDYQQSCWANFESAAGKMDSFLLQHQISCHLLRRLDLHIDNSQLLALDLNYYVKLSFINGTIETLCKRFPNDICRMYHLKDVVGGDRVPSLYLNSNFNLNIFLTK